jgi:hypothetical protein
MNHTSRLCGNEKETIITIKQKEKTKVEDSITSSVQQAYHN